MKRLITILLALSMIFGFAFVISIFALEVEEKPEIEIADEALTPTYSEESEELQPIAVYSCGKDEYSTRLWKNMDEALHYYGVQLNEVHKCYVVHLGINYYYYIQMSSFKIYFNVEEGSWA